jgi:hypothetical protein
MTNRPTLPAGVVWCEECCRTHDPDEDTRDCTGRWFELTLGEERDRPELGRAHHDDLPVAHRSDSGRVKLHVRPKVEHDKQGMHDTRLDEKARQYVVSFDGKRVGIVVKLYRLGYVHARNCVGGSCHGNFEWYFFNEADEHGPDATADYIKTMARTIEWELTWSERHAEATA